MSREYIIDRSKWACGGSRHVGVVGMSYLLNGSGFMCCLGQMCIQDGILKKKLNGIENPFQVKKVYPRAKVSDWMLRKDDAGETFNSKLVDKMIEVNDESRFSDKQREEKLTRLIKKSGNTVRFKGKYPWSKKKKERT